jgi:hypothetical protein
MVARYLVVDASEPSSRIGTVDKITNVVPLLASDGSGNFTGIELFLRGGLAKVQPRYATVVASLAKMS